MTTQRERPLSGLLYGTVGHLARQGLRPAVNLAREGLARSRLRSLRCGAGPVAVFLPAGPAKGAALLRIYNIAEALRPLGWRTVVVPWQLTLPARHRFLAAICPDVMVMQGARHTLNRPEVYPGCPIVYDMDDADFHLAHLAGPVQAAMGQVACVVAGSRYIADWSRANGAPDARVVWTGTPVAPGPLPGPAERGPVVAWAQTRPQHYTREAALVARVMAAVAAQHPGVTLRLYDRRPGDDPAFAARFKVPGLRVEWRATCAYDAYLHSFDDVAVGLAPLCPQTPFSRGKSFGKVLAYLDRGAVVVGSDAGEHGAFFTDATGIITNDETAWTDAILRCLEAAPLRQEIAVAARARFATHLSVEAAAAAMADVLTAQISRPDPAPRSVAGGGCP